MTTENEKELKWLIQQRKDLERKIREKKTAAKKPPRPEIPMFLPYPPSLDRKEKIIFFDSYTPQRISVQDLLVEIQKTFPNKEMNDIFIVKERHGMYESSWDEFYFVFEGSVEERIEYQKECKKIDKQNKKIRDKYNRELRKWEELYG